MTKKILVILILLFAGMGEAVFSANYAYDSTTCGVWCIYTGIKKDDHIARKFLKGMEGYADYQKRVKYKLFPGIF